MSFVGRVEAFHAVSVVYIHSVFVFLLSSCLCVRIVALTSFNVFFCISRVLESIAASSRSEVVVRIFIFLGSRCLVLSRGMVLCCSAVPSLADSRELEDDV